MRLFVNLHVMPSNFEALLWKFKYFITALIMLHDYFCRTPLEGFSVFWKSGENFNPEQLTNHMSAGNNFTENFNADVPVEIFWNV